MRRLLAALLIVIFSRPLAAQSTATAASIRSGARVRITLSDGEQRTGVVVRTATDTLFVRWPQFTNADVVPLAGISRLEVSTGGQRNLLRGMGVGLVAGATLGTAAGWFGTGSDSQIGKGAMAAAGGVSCGALGLLVGALGALWRGEDWSALSTEPGRLKTGIVPRDHGVGFSVSFRH